MTPKDKIDRRIRTAEDRARKRELRDLREQYVRTRIDFGALRSEVQGFKVRIDAQRKRIQDLEDLLRAALGVHAGRPLPGVRLVLEPQLDDPSPSKTRVTKSYVMAELRRRGVDPAIIAHLDAGLEP